MSLMSICSRVGDTSAIEVTDYATVEGCRGLSGIYKGGKGVIGSLEREHVFLCFLEEGEIIFIVLEGISRGFNLLFFKEFRGRRSIMGSYGGF